VRQLAKADNLFAVLMVGNFPAHADDDALTLFGIHKAANILQVLSL
jgi:hypothetical protein